MSWNQCEAHNILMFNNKNNKTTNKQKKKWEKKNSKLLKFSLKSNQTL